MTETALATTAIYSARPVIEVARRRPEVVQQLLLAMDMREAEGGLSSLELRFVNVATHERGGVDFAFEHSDTDLLALGASIRVLAGDEADPMEIFSGGISAVEFAFEEDGQPELCIHAEDALMGQRMRRFTRSHPAGPLRDILEDLAVETGLTPSIRGLTDRVDVQIQLNESSLAFMRRLLTDYDADLQVVGNELHIARRSDIQRGSLTLALGSQLTRVRLYADLADAGRRLCDLGNGLLEGRDVQPVAGLRAEPDAAAGLAHDALVTFRVGCCQRAAKPPQRGVDAMPGAALVDLVPQDRGQHLALMGAMAVHHQEAQQHLARPRQPHQLPAFAPAHLGTAEQTDSEFRHWRLPYATRISTVRADSL